MTNIRKIVLLSALLMSASSITAPTYAMIDDEQGASVSRTIHAQVPSELTQNIIQDIRKNGSFLTVAKEYVLQNPEQLDSFASYLTSDSYSLFMCNQSCFTMYGGLKYLIQENGFSLYLNPNYDPERREKTGPEWFEDGDCMELSRLIFKEQDRAFESEKPLAVSSKVEEQENGSGAASSMQASMSSDSFSEDAVKATIIKNLPETYKSNPEALEKAFAAFFANLK